MNQVILQVKSKNHSQFQDRHALNSSIQIKKHYFQIMIKSKYLLSQETCCGLPGNFTIHELSDESPAQQQQSGLSELNFAPQQNVGNFQQTGSSFLCCFSCKNVKELSLQMYGQRLSDSTSQSKCCFNLCSGELTVATMNKVIIGKIKKTCSAWCSHSVLTIQDQTEKEIFFLRMKCCQMGAFLPRIFRCHQNVHYEIFNAENKTVGTITNIFRDCKTVLFTLRDDFQIHFTESLKDKEKILLLNSVVLLNQIKHEWF